MRELTVFRWQPGDHEPGLHHVGSSYVERWYLPVVGPTQVALLRLLATTLPPGEELTLPSAVIASGLGIAPTTKSAYAGVGRVYTRLEQFRLAEVHPLDEERVLVAAHRYVPFVSDNRTRRWHPALQAAHAARKEAMQRELLGG